jgi:hypothetical protein
MAKLVNSSDSPGRKLLLGLSLLCAATLAFEINLTRLFSVAQFYHFAFLIVSMALLGFGASGTYLAIRPNFGGERAQDRLAGLALWTGISMLGAYLLTNWLPFDSFRIAWDLKQVLILIGHYLALSTPFFFSGLATGMLLARYPNSAGRTYAANLIGSAAGCAVVLIAPTAFGGEGTVLLCTGIALFGALVSSRSLFGSHAPKCTSLRGWITGFLLALTLLGLGAMVLKGGAPAWLALHVSPYKGISYALQYPGAQIISQRWNAISRIDVVRSAGVRSLPGLSYRYTQPPPPEDGLMIDGDELSAILQPGYTTDFFDYLPAGIAYRLKPGGRALILEPRGGLDVLSAIELGAVQISVVEANPLVVGAAASIYNDPRVSTFVESDRSYLRRSQAEYDLIVLSLASNFHPVRSGAYSLAEEYRYTVESFEDALGRLGTDGILVVTRWLQNPPSESLRAFALTVEAIEKRGGNPAEQIAAFRGYNTATILAKNEAFSKPQLDSLRTWAAETAFDLIYTPDIRPEEANQYNILPEPLYYQSFLALLNTQPRTDFYRSYPYEVQPPTDDRPFFGHYFKWSQSSQILVEFGKTWQPFGGAGYFILLALLVLAILMAALVILLPAAGASLRRTKTNGQAKAFDKDAAAHLVYFALIGLGFLLVEIPLIQRFILFLGYPAYAMTAVLFTLLLFSGLGSRLSARVRLEVGIGGLVVLLVLGSALLPAIIRSTLGAPFWARLALTVIMLAPLGLLMGIPFPGGIRWMITRLDQSALVPWIWAINGAASVVASVLAAFLALSLGFTWVLWIGAACYGGCWLIVMAATRRRQYLHR